MSKTKESQDQMRRQHVQEMKEQLKRHLGESQPLYFGNLSLKQEEEFLEQLLFMEGVNEEPLFDILVREGVPLPAPTTLDDEQIKTKLWAVINVLALLGQYLSRTDHLSDRQLYELLWTQILREPASVCPGNPNAACFIDILGGCSEEDFLINLKYYAEEEERLDWAEEYPDDIIPPHEPLPYDRDRHLPGAPFDCTHSREAS